jgi:hypothetical protein
MKKKCLEGEKCDNKQVLVNKYSPTVTEQQIAPTSTAADQSGANQKSGPEFKECALT